MVCCACWPYLLALSSARTIRCYALCVRHGADCVPPLCAAVWPRRVAPAHRLLRVRIHLPKQVRCDNMQRQSDSTCMAWAVHARQLVWCQPGAMQGTGRTPSVLSAFVTLAQQHSDAVDPAAGGLTSWRRATMCARCQTSPTCMATAGAHLLQRFTCQPNNPSSTCCCSRLGQSACMLTSPALHATCCACVDAAHMALLQVF